MNTRSSFLDPIEADRAFIEGSVELRPDNAVAAIIQPGAGRYLMQLRDPFDWIFFPGHWGLFGGAVETGETSVDALARELSEELELNISEEDLRYFTRLDLDFSFADYGMIRRDFYQLLIEPDDVEKLKLAEGAGLRVFTGNEILLEPRVTPYDRWVIWLFESQGRIKIPMSQDQNG